jgi:hypothetical protein
LAYNFNDNTFSPPGTTPARGTLNASTPAPETPSATSPSPASVDGPAPAPTRTDAPVTSDSPQSAAFVRFRSCRWMQPAENGNTEFCTHREVKPYAGTQGFDADAWCPDCQYYKLRRAPKKREPRDDYSY